MQNLYPIQLEHCHAVNCSKRIMRGHYKRFYGEVCQRRRTDAYAVRAACADAARYAWDKAEKRPEESAIQYYILTSY